MELYREKEFWIAAETTVLLETLAKECFTHLWGKTPSRGGKKHWKNGRLNDFCSVQRAGD